LIGRLRIAVFASGRGSNLKAILDAIKSGRVPNALIALVISNNSGSGALEIGRTNSIPSLHLSRKQFDSDEAFDTTVLSALREHAVNFIVLAGYMKRVAPPIIGAFKNRIVNIHPALLPSFGGPGMYGRFVHEAVIRSGAAVSGATVHIVDEEYDQGRIVLQRSIPIAPDETPDSLAAKVSLLEHEIYPEAIRMFAEGEIFPEEEHVITESES
jgi:phosphoribosylglycinamide formyltransferase 1